LARRHQSSILARCSVARPVYSRKYRRQYPSCTAAAVAMREVSISATYCNISLAANATARGEYVTAYGSQWAFVDSIPEQWPAKPKRKGVVKIMSPITRSDGQKFPTVKAAAKSVFCSSTAICRAAIATAERRYLKIRCYQWAYTAAAESPGFTWPEAPVKPEKPAKPKKPSPVERRPRTRRVMRSDGVVFDSLSEAARAVGCSQPTISLAVAATEKGVYLKRCLSQWAYAETAEQPGFTWPAPPAI